MRTTCSPCVRRPTPPTILSLAICAITLLSCVSPAVLCAQPLQKVAEVAYGTRSRSQTLDLYLPTSKGLTPYPLVVWIHGGGWNSGNKENPPVLSMLPPGMALASLNYRLSTEAPFPAQIQDVFQGVRFLQTSAARYGYHPNRIAVVGSSAGAHLAALVALAPQVREFDPTTTAGAAPLVQAACLLATPSDLESLFPLATGPQRAVVELFLGGAAASRKALMQLASPNRHVRAPAPPMLLLHGTADTTVPPAQSQLFFQQLKQANIDAQLVLIPGAGHYLLNGETLVRKSVQEFLRRHLEAPQP